MDPARVARIRDDLEDKSADELRQLESGGQAEEKEAARQILAARSRLGAKFIFAQVLGVVFAGVGGGVAWTQGVSLEISLLAAIVCAFLGFACVYIPNLFGQP